MSFYYYYYLARPTGIEPLSSIPLLYATGLEDLCGVKGWVKFHYT